MARVDRRRAQRGVPLCLPQEEDAAETAVIRVAPAAKASVEALEKFTCVCSSDVVMTCTVCMDEVSSGTQLTRMPCCHVFHEDCTVKWLETRHTCPVCRFELPIREI
ncbi:43kDa postsynaptic protein [Trema orientale]|uniref:RING-type E3 ubiquitin transferase n=1 Tax=Trema orientale TaxID=63057 RepID=A0A2P5F4Z4_TREOI|nr:43kDa postsynaptic protein [Trema orientale]